MYLLRAFGVIVSTIIHATISILLSFFDPTGVKQNRIAQRWGKSLLWIAGVTVEVEGLEKISASGSYVIVSNHLSFMDTPVVLASIPVQYRFMAKEGLFKIPFLGTHLTRAGHIPVPLEDPRAAIRSMQLAAETIRQKSISVLVFPEGGRSDDGFLHEFKEGGFYIGIKAGVPIVPVALIGTREVLPFGAWHIEPHHVTLRIGEPIETSALTIRDRATVTAEAHRRIANMLA